MTENRFPGSTWFPSFDGRARVRLVDRRSGTLPAGGRASPQSRWWCSRGNPSHSLRRHSAAAAAPAWTRVGIPKDDWQNSEWSAGSHRGPDHLSTSHVGWNERWEGTRESWLRHGKRCGGQEADELKPQRPAFTWSHVETAAPVIERNNTPQTLPHAAKLVFGAVDETGRPGELRSPWIGGGCPHARLCSMRRSMRRSLRWC